MQLAQFKKNLIQRHVAGGTRGKKLRDQHHMIGVKDDSFVLICQTRKKPLLQ